jgi:hypothetical protein
LHQVLVFSCAYWPVQVEGFAALLLTHRSPRISCTRAGTG